MKITPAADRPSRSVPDTWFTGTVWQDPIIAAGSPSKIRALYVAFAPGARNAWHTHPHGQTLHVVSGVGLIQLAGQPSQLIRPGDVIWIEPGERHWHGAAPDHTMVHLAIQEADDAGVDVVWFDKVTDAEYAGKSR
jgi:quercetin dioxygenase-like cupin family protein